MQVGTRARLCSYLLEMDRSYRVPSQSGDQRWSLQFPEWSPLLGLRVPADICTRCAGQVCVHGIHDGVRFIWGD